MPKGGQYLLRFVGQLVVVIEIHVAAPTTNSKVRASGLPVAAMVRDDFLNAAFHVVWPHFFHAGLHNGSRKRALRRQAKTETRDVYQTNDSIQLCNAHAAKPYVSNSSSDDGPSCLSAGKMHLKTFSHSHDLTNNS